MSRKDVLPPFTLEFAYEASSVGGSVGYWQVDKLDHVVSKAIGLGAELYRGPLKVQEIRRIIVQIKDPMGNVVGFEETF